MNKATANYWVDMLIALAFVLSAISGLVFLLPGDIETGVLWVSYRAWNTLHTWTNPPADAAWTSHFPSLEARHLRWIYAEKITGNVGLDGVAVRAWTEPGLAAVSATGGLLRAEIPDGSLCRTYRLEQADALTHPTAVDWQNVEEKPGADGLLEWTLPLPTNRLRFYRVRDVTVGMPLP